MTHNIVKMGKLNFIKIKNFFSQRLGEHIKTIEDLGENICKSQDEYKILK